MVVNPKQSLIGVIRNFRIALEELNISPPDQIVLQTEEEVLRVYDEIDLLRRQPCGRASFYSVMVDGIYITSKSAVPDPI